MCAQERCLWAAGHEPLSGHSWKLQHRSRADAVQPQACFLSIALEHAVQIVEGTPGKVLVPHRVFLPEIKDLGRMRPQTPIVGAAAFAPPLACPTSHEKGPSIAAAQVLLCVALRLRSPY